MPQDAATEKQTARGSSAPPAVRTAPALVRNLRRLPRPGSFSEGDRPEETLRRDALYRRSLILVDATAAAAAITTVTLMRQDALRSGIFFIVPLVVLLSKVAGLYERDQLVLRKTTLEEAPGLLQVATLSTLLVYLFQESLVTDHLNQAEGVAFWGALLVVMLVGRTAARVAVGSVARPERVVVIGDRQSAIHLRNKFEEHGQAPAKIIGRIAFGSGRRRGEDRLGSNGNEPVPLLGEIHRLPHVLKGQSVDRVIIAAGPLPSDDVLEVIRLAKGLGVHVSVLPSLFEVVGSSVEFDDVGGIVVLGLRHYGLSRSSRALKRTFDLVIGSLVLLALTPAFILISIAIKLDSRGPVFFRQRRIGRRDDEFEIVKFRTMVVGADGRKQDLLDLNEAEGLFKIANDPRITRVGRLLRRTGLDELPQLFNVMRGDMSLVGPRPLVPDEDRRVEGWARRRLEVPPGMTGHWQVLGSARVPLREMLKIDYLYGANWSLWGDMKILLRTIPFVVSRRGL
ncbi:MAG TPA: sugar transferase [Thermoleophilaceae bacterium]|nr:sugar transferase [Thermoleophilaceae bacterium]